LGTPLFVGRSSGLPGRTGFQPVRFVYSERVGSLLYDCAKLEVGPTFRLLWATFHSIVEPR
jgi:hypothetical protein